MANEQNLIPQAHKLTVEEQSKGGKISGEKRRQRKTFAEAFDIWLTSDHVDKKGTRMNGMDILVAAMVQKASKGDVRAFEVIRDSVGEKPVEKIATVEIPDDVRSKVESLVENYESENGIQDTDGTTS